VRALLCGSQGKEYLIASSVAAMRRPSGESFGTVVVFRDITDRAVLEGQLAQAQKMESLGRLAGGIAHDFNNLLTSIQGYADLVRMELEQSAQERGRSNEYIEAVLRSSQRGSDLVGQLLAFSRRADASTEPLDLHVVLEQSVKMLQRTLDPAIEITLDTSATEHIVEANASLLVNVFLNLGINAGDAMVDGGRLRFSTCLRGVEKADGGQMQGLPAGVYLQVDVEDEGSGMSEAMRERIFEPFFTTKDLGDGTGLGLPTAMSTIHSFGGTILVDSELGRGTTMCVLLPLVAGGKPQVDARKRSKPPRGSSTLLMIEDDYAVRELCSEYLTSLGYRLLLAPDGEEGLELFQTHRKAVDLVIVDYLMPLRNGMEVVRAVRRSDAEMPILMMTGFSLGVSEEEILAQGVQAVLTKPFLPEDLAAKVGALLGAGGKAVGSSGSG